MIKLYTAAKTQVKVVNHVLITYIPPVHTLLLHFVNGCSHIAWRWAVTNHNKANSCLWWLVHYWILFTNLQIICNILFKRCYI